MADAQHYLADLSLTESQKVSRPVTPAKAGVQNVLKILDSGFRRNDQSIRNPTFCESIIIMKKLVVKNLVHIYTARK